MSHCTAPDSIHITRLSLLNDRIRERVGNVLTCDTVAQNLVSSCGNRRQKWSIRGAVVQLLRMVLRMWRLVKRLFRLIAKQSTMCKLLLLCGRRIEHFFRNLTFRQRYLIAGILLGSLPDIDIFLGRFLGGHHQFHRTITHSVYGNLVLVPVASVVVQLFLGLRGLRSYGHCVVLTTLCVVSHLITDFITNYGVCGQQRSVSLVIRIRSLL